MIIEYNVAVPSGGSKRGEIEVYSATTRADKSALTEYIEKRVQERKRNKTHLVALLASKKRILKAVEYNFKTGKKIQSARSVFRLTNEKVQNEKVHFAKVFVARERMNINEIYGAHVAPTLTKYLIKHLSVR
jgi:hypothetical protein